MLVTDEFVFVHVPKTGGTFLGDAIRQTCEVRHESLHALYQETPSEYAHLPAIGFVRNPWAWYVSWWMHQFQNGPFDEWPYKRFEVCQGDFAHSLDLMFDHPRGVDYYGAVAANALRGGAEVGRTENLRGDFIGFLDAHGIQAEGLREAVGSSPPTNVGGHDYRSFYDDRTRRLVGRSRVATRYGYEF